MFSALKRFFGRSSQEEATPPLLVLPPPGPEASTEALPHRGAGYDLPEIDSLEPGADPLIIPFAAILQQVPAEYCGKLAPAGVAGCQFSIAKAEVLEQLPRGAVKVPLAELKRWVPPGVFADHPHLDQQLVDLPLHYLLRQLCPEDYAPRNVQHPVEVPVGIADIFDAKGPAAASVRVMPQAETPPGPVPAPAARPRPTPPPTAAARTLPSSPAPTADGPSFNFAPRIPVAAPATTPFRRPSPLTSASGPMPAAAAAREAAPPAQGVANLQHFLIALEEVAVNWPEPIRTEIAQLKVPFAKCALPSAEVCEGLKRGQIQYTWGQLRARIHPHPPTGPSALADTLLDLPLKILTPLFLDFIRSSAAARKPVDSERVTEFFRKAERAPVAPAPAPSASRAIPLATPAPAPVAVPAPAPLAAPAGMAPTMSKIKMALPTPPAPVADVPAEPEPEPPVAEKVPATRSGCLSLPLHLVSGGWPEPVQQEIAKAGLDQARIEIPFPAIEPALRLGKIEFQWLQICSWLSPAPALDYESPYSEARLSLPLPVVAPIFLQQKLKKLKGQKRVVPEGIPDLFTAGGTPLAAAASADSPAAAPTAPEPEAPATPPPVRIPTPLAATVKPAAPGAPVAAEAAESAPEVSALPPARPTNLAELFGEPNKRKWTPNDIVNRLVHFPGVAGAMIALQDGLLVAHCMPPGVKADTIAAFLPQIIGRMSQYAKEFQMGDLTGVTLTIAQGTLQIYHPGVIYFAALGRPGTPLPLEQLDFVAAELSRRGK